MGLLIHIYKLVPPSLSSYLQLNADCYYCGACDAYPTCTSSGVHVCLLSYMHVCMDPLAYIAMMCKWLRLTRAVINIL